MDRRLARKNVQTGLILAVFGLLVVAFTFVVAAIYLA
jgi:uncharacterized membrane protein (DUF485 family)